MKLFKKAGAASAWPDRMVLYSVLVTTRSMLENISSKKSFYGNEPKEVLETINQAINRFHDSSENIRHDNLIMLFAPTGAIQEISMSNGWDKVYLKLADSFDKTVYTLSEINVTSW